MPPSETAAATVLLLHGLARTRWSLWRVERALREAGYATLNPGHPTRSCDLAGLVAHARHYLEALAPGDPLTLHGVGHSLGGVVLRAVLADPPRPWRARRLVTIASPHRGAKLVGTLLKWRAARAFYGPVLNDLRWDSDALQALAATGPGPVEVGAIAGAGRFRPFVPGALINARLGLTAETDGTVELASAFGAPWWPPFADTLVVDAGHTFIAARPEVIRQTLHFLRHGRFAGRNP